MERRVRRRDRGRQGPDRGAVAVRRVLVPDPRSTDLVVAQACATLGIDSQLSDDVRLAIRGLLREEQDATLAPGRIPDSAVLTGGTGER
jgi:hypothetical protein